MRGDAAARRPPSERAEASTIADVSQHRRGSPSSLAASVLGVVARAVLRTRDLREHFVSGAGLAQGALIAAIALGVVLTYRGSGVVNFANGAIAMYVALRLRRAAHRRRRSSCRRCRTRSRSSKASCTGFRPSDDFRPARLADADLVRRGAGVLAGARRLAACSASLLGPGAALPDLPAAAHRAAAGQGRRVGRGCCSSSRRSSIRRFGTTPRDGQAVARSRQASRSTSRCSQITQEQLFVRGARDRLHGRAVGALPVHPLRSRDARRRREREGRRACSGSRPTCLAGINWVLSTVHHRAARHPRRVDQLDVEPIRGAGPDRAGAHRPRWSAASRSFG